MSLAVGTWGYTPTFTPKRRRHLVGTLLERRGSVGDLAKEPHWGRGSWEGSHAGDSGGGNTASSVDGAGMVRFNMRSRRGMTTTVV
jgi:hypothetical protein